MTRLLGDAADRTAAFFVAGFSVLLAGPAGLLWTALAPHAQVVVDANSANFADGVSEVFVAGDAWFAGVSLLAGLLLGGLAWAWVRGSGPFVVVALAAGGLLAGYLTARVGTLPGRDALQAAVDARRPATLAANVALQSTLLVLVWPLGALTAFVALVVGRPDESAEA